MQRFFGLPQRGAVLPLVAICLAVLMGFAGMAVDIGFLEYQQQVQQAATDAAAMGAAQEAYADSCNNPADAVSAAMTDAALNGFSSPDVQATSPPSTGQYAGVNCAVSVTINQKKATFFSQILGFYGMNESTQAVGVANLGSTTGCVWLLDTSAADQSNFSNSNIAVPHCSIYINAFANMSNATIDASYIGYANGTNNTSGTTFTNATPQPMAAISDPCPTFSGCAWLTKNGPQPNACTGDYNGGSGNQTVNGGCYNNFTMSGTGVVCGLIEVTGTQLHLNGSTLTSCSSGVTFAMASSVSDVNFSGSTTLTLSAPTSGNTAGVVFWRNSAQSNSVNYSTCVCTLTGMLYYPTTYVNYSSNSGAYSLLVFGQGNFSTSTGLAIGTPAPGYGSGPRAALGE